MSAQVLKIEIVGVAGSGKSTLARTLLARNPDWRLADTLHTRLPAHWPYVAHGLPKLLTMRTRSARLRPGFDWSETKTVLYVSEWARFLYRRPEYRTGTVLLDQGPVFGLASMLWGEKPAIHGASYRSWSRRMVERWSDELDAVVLLDAPDALLIERIDGRAQRHDAKGRPRAEALALVGAHRAAYAQVFADIDRFGRLPVLRLDSSAHAPAELAEIVEAYLADSSARPLTESKLGVNVG